MKIRRANEIKLPEVYVNILLTSGHIIAASQVKPLSSLRRRSITSCDALYFISLSSLVDYYTALNLLVSPWQGNLYLLRLRFNHGGVLLKMALTCDGIALF